MYDEEEARVWHGEEEGCYCNTLHRSTEWDMHFLISCCFFLVRGGGGKGEYKISVIVKHTNPSHPYLGVTEPSESNTNNRGKRRGSRGGDT